MGHYETAEERWRAVLGRDTTARQAFVYAVTSTGIYCRPGCPSKPPLRETVRFFDGPDAAEAAGFRACQRCMPQSVDEPVFHRDAVLKVCRLIDESDEALTLRALATEVGLSASQLHRLFKAQVGLTPKQYAMAKREERAKHALEMGKPVTDVVFEAGYGSSSPFYAQAEGHLGMRPAAYRNKGEGEMIRFATAPCDLGWLLVAATAKGLCAVQLGDDPAELVEVLRKRFSRADEIVEDGGLAEAITQVADLLTQPGQGFKLPLDIQGTVFQQRVWQALREIPPGRTATYKEIAERIGQPSAVRAVASACGANKLAVIIPCHRVIRSDGGLGGYRWGLERKSALLERERGD